MGDQFCQLKLETVQGILQRDDLAAEEIEVLDAVKKWCSYKPERAEHLKSMLDLVRFPVMDPKDLGLLDQDPIYSQFPELMHKKMFEALIYSADHTAVEDTTAKRFQMRLQNEFDKTWDFDMGAVIHKHVVGNTGFFRFVAKGAKADDGRYKKGGRGAIIEATFFLKKGDVLEILTGGMSSKRGDDSGGGGGTFVSINGRKNPLIVAGGGGGTRGASGDMDGSDASLTTDGTPGVGAQSSAGGKNGEGGVCAANKYGGAGAGYFTDASDPASDSGPGTSFVNGGAGGGSNGGWGGGGDAGSSGGGGGGGYSGGGGGQGGGGGGSFVRADALDIVKSIKNSTHGSLQIFSVKKPRKDDSASSEEKTETK